MPEIEFPPDPLNLMAEFVIAIANARLRDELTTTEWKIIIDEVIRT